MQGTPWHYEYLSDSNGKKNNKNCAFNDEGRCSCKISVNYNKECIGKRECDEFEYGSFRGRRNNTYVSDSDSVTKTYKTESDINPYTENYKNGGINEDGELEHEIELVLSKSKSKIFKEAMKEWRFMYGNPNSNIYNVKNGEFLFVSQKCIHVMENEKPIEYNKVTDEKQEKGKRKDYHREYVDETLIGTQINIENSTDNKCKKYYNFRSDKKTISASKNKDIVLADHRNENDDMIPIYAKRRRKFKQDYKLVEIKINDMLNKYTNGNFEISLCLPSGYQFELKCIENNNHTLIKWDRIYEIYESSNKYESINLLLKLCKKVYNKKKKEKNYRVKHKNKQYSDCEYID